MKCAFYYIEQWIPYTLEVVDNIGITVSERQIQHALKLIQERESINRSTLMRIMKLTSRLAKDIIDTLWERGEITVDKTVITSRRPK